MDQVPLTSREPLLPNEHPPFVEPPPYRHAFLHDPITTVLATRCGLDGFGEPVDEWVTHELDGLDPACLIEETSPVDEPLPAPAAAGNPVSDPDYDEISFEGLDKEEWPK